MKAVPGLCAAWLAACFRHGSSAQVLDRSVDVLTLSPSAGAQGQAGRSSSTPGVFVSNLYPATAVADRVLGYTIFYGLRNSFFCFRV